VSRDYSLVCTIVTRDYEAICAYQCDLYEQCFHFGDENVDFLLFHTEVDRTTGVLTVANMLDFNRSDMLLLMDSSCLSLFSLARLHGVFDTDSTDSRNLDTVTQLILSMYLLVQSKLQTLDIFDV